MTPPAPPRRAPLLSMERIEKSFPGVRALQEVGLELHSGEVLGLGGENGAGKSTLIKVLSGVHPPDGGRIRIDGADPRIRSPLDAKAAGVAVIYQEFNLVPTLTVLENIFLGNEETRGGFLSPRKERAAAMDLFGRLRVAVDPDAPCGGLTVAEQQIVEIAKALSQRGRIIVMDEPSAALTSQEVENLFRIIRDLRADGIGVIYISHRLEEVFEIADRVMVMRDGLEVVTRPVQEISREEIIEQMVGRKLEEEFPKERIAPGRDRLVVEGLSRGKKVVDVSFRVRGGEVLGIAGLVGAGRTEVARLIFGADRRDSGRISLDGRDLGLRTPLEAIRAGICLLTEDRKSQGLVLGLPARENFGLPNLAHWSRLGFIDVGKEEKALSRYVEGLRIKIHGPEVMTANLSGGNQQKLVLAKWLESNSEVVIFDEPTRGIDVGAKYEIYLLINDLARRGKGIILISSELPEILGMSDRILVMREGRVTGEIRAVQGATQEDVLALAVGVPEEAQP